MKNAVLLVTYNNLALTKEAVASVMAQDIGPLHIWIVNNGSTDPKRSQTVDEPAEKPAAAMIGRPTIYPAGRSTEN
ncbi:MAG: glycosyltransferase family 2 protein, partial [Bryobacteraceae bacterium]